VLRAFAVLAGMPPRREVGSAARQGEAVTQGRIVRRHSQS
jgi:hypothetical protein